MSDSTTPIAGTPRWIEIPSPDVPASKSFYAALFPSWTFSPLPAHLPADEVALFTLAAPKGLSGGIVKVPEITPTDAAVNVYWYVQSIEEIEKRILELGGSVVGEKTEEGENGWFQRFRDPWGVGVAVFESREGCGC